MKVEILFPTIERWHCIDMVMKNIDIARKPDDIQVLATTAAPEDYCLYVERKFRFMFDKVRVIRRDSEAYEHDKVRADFKRVYQLKRKSMFEACIALHDNADESVDYYWFIEDDTLFPPDVFYRYLNIMEGLKADVVSGVSYYWHTDKYLRNFWKIKETKVFGDDDTSDEVSVSIEHMPIQEEGVVRLGATGFGNVLIKRDAFLSWAPDEHYRLGLANDTGFYYHLAKNGYKAYGVWDIYLPHITKYDNGDIEIRGRIHPAVRKAVMI